MLSTLISIIGILVTIFFVIGTHESAHFFTARFFGVKVLRFSIGFGKTLFRWHDKSGTEYVIALVPLGGYVKMLDETEEAVPVDLLPYAYNRQAFYKKFLIVLAGPLCNLLCALLLYWAIFMIGFVTVAPVIGAITPGSIAAKAGLSANAEITAVDQEQTLTWTGVLLRLLAHYGDSGSATVTVKYPLVAKKTQQEVTTATHELNLTDWQMNNLTPDPFSSLGITPYEPPIPLIINMIAPDSPAATSGLKIGDKIISIKGKSVSHWRDISSFVFDNPDETVTFTVERELKSLSFPVKIGSQRHLFAKRSGYLGIGPEVKMPEDMLRKIQYGPIAAFSAAAKEMTNFVYFNLVLFGKLITGKLSTQSLGGPLTIFESAGTALNYGILSFLHFLAFISISIGVINLFPIPGLDGGHLFIQLVEAIIRRPVPEKILAMLYGIGIFIIVFVLIQSLANDLLRLA